MVNAEKIAGSIERMGNNIEWLKRDHASIVSSIAKAAASENPSMNEIIALANNAKDIEAQIHVFVEKRALLQAILND